MYLNSHSCYSFRYGTISPEDLIKEALARNIEGLALTDINNTSAAMDFLRDAKKVGIKAVAGVDFREKGQRRFIALAEDNWGWKDINRYLSEHLHQKKPFPVQAPDWDHCQVIYKLGDKNPQDLRENEYLGIPPDGVHRIAELRSFQAKLVLLQPITFLDRTGFQSHRLLRAIDKNILLSQLNPNDQAEKYETFRDPAEIAKTYGAFPKLLANTLNLLDRCDLSFDWQASKNRKSFTGNPSDDRQLLSKLAGEGMLNRFGAKNKKAAERVEHELKIIDKMGFNAYFLITWDIIRYAVSRNFGYVGRGSGANSIVAYCLRITDVDPIDLDLYFERFLNPHRSAPPDFDIDFSWKDRDEVIDYIFKRYGSEHTALLGSYNTFKGRSVIRELGKVFGLPKPEIDAISGSRNPDMVRDKDPIKRSIFKYGKHLEGLPNHLSIHAGGVLITEEPITAYTATDLPPKGFPTTHFDMYVAEDHGFYKYDILSQRGLGHIKESIRLIRENRGKAEALDDIPAIMQDSAARSLIRTGKTIGCFYIESPAMRMLLKKLKCDDYLTLVAASSIIRPGVAKSGMMREYIHRFHHPDSFEYIHPKMGEILEDTYGVMVYQEDVIKVAHHFAGLDLAEADILRRGMSGKSRSRKQFDRIAEKFFQNCLVKGYDPSITQEVWRQIESFSGYSFSKAHSASFAVESFQSLWLKAHYPLEFMVAVINNFGGFYRTEFYVHEARMWGANILPPCVNNSEQLSCIMGKDIYLGFIHLKDLELEVSRIIYGDRQAAGPFTNLDDFIQRTGISLEQLNILIRIGALRFTGKCKKELLWLAVGRYSDRKPAQKGKGLFKSQLREFKIPRLENMAYDDAFDEIELLGFPICDPFELINRKKVPPHPDAPLIGRKDMELHFGKVVWMIGYLVVTKDVRTSTKELMHFGHFVDSEGLTFDSTHFPSPLRQYPFKGKGFYLMKGKIDDDFGYPSLEVNILHKLPMVNRKHPEQAQRKTA
jgi:DNA-directed DNA polymerase III PolC